MSVIYSWSPMQQPDSNSSKSRGKECCLSRGRGRMSGDPVGGSKDGSSPVLWVVAERERVMWRKGEGVYWGHETHEREDIMWWWGWWSRWWGPESIWFGASRASFPACGIPGDQHRGVSFHPNTHRPPRGERQPNTTLFLRHLHWTKTNQDCTHIKNNNDTTEHAQRSSLYVGKLISFASAHYKVKH